MEDVWISRRQEDMPRWLAETSVREGIRAMLKKDGCLYEHRRLGRESDSLCRWLGNELTAVELAVRTPKRELLLFPQHPHILRYILTDSLLHVLLAEHRRELCFLEKRWSTPLVSDIRLRVAIQEAVKTAQVLAGEDPVMALHWKDPLFTTTAVTVVVVDDTTESLQLPESLSVNCTLDSDILIADDELEDGGDFDDDGLIEKANTVVLWTLPVSI